MIALALTSFSFALSSGITASLQIAEKCSGEISNPGFYCSGIFLLEIFLRNDVFELGPVTLGHNLREFVD